MSYLETIKYKENSAINEVEKMKLFISKIMNSEFETNPKKIYPIYLIKSEMINKSEKYLKGNKINKVEEFSLINKFEQLKNEIYNERNFYIILKDRIINNLTNKFKGITSYPPIESYMGNHKIIIFFDNNSILIIADIKGKKAKKYFETKIQLNHRDNTKTNAIRKILNIKINYFFKTNFIIEGIEFIELNSLKNENQNTREENLNKKGTLTIEYLKINPIKSNNLENNIQNNKNNQNNNNQNNNNQFLSNKPFNESIQESLPKDSIKIIQNNQESQIISNNLKNTNTENIPIKKEETNNNNRDVVEESKQLEIEEIKREIKQSYEDEKLKKMYEKKIGEELYNNLMQTDVNKLIEQNKLRKQLINKIASIEGEIQMKLKKVQKISVQNEEKNNYFNSIKDKESKYLTREQIFKRNDIDKRYLGNISKENIKKIEELNKKIVKLEEEKNKKIKELEEVEMSIQMINEDMYGIKSMKYKNEMMEKSIEDTDKLILIDRDKEQLKNLQFKIKRQEYLNYEQKLELEAKRKKEEERLKKLREIDEIKRQKELEEKNQKLQEEEKKKKLEEREENIHRKKIEEIQMEQKWSNERINQRYKDIKKVQEEEMKKLNKEKEEVINNYNKYLEKKFQEDNKEEIEQKEKEKRESLWKKGLEESNNRQKLNEQLKLQATGINEKLSEIKEEIIEEEKEKISTPKKENIQELKDKPDFDLNNNQKDDEEIKKQKEMEEKIKQEELRKKEEMEEKIKQEELRKKKEMEEKIKQEELRKKKEMEEKLMKEELEKHKKEIEEALKNKKQKELEEQMKKQKELEEQLKKQKEVEEQIKKQKEQEEQIKKQKELEAQIKKQKELEIQNQNQIVQKPLITCKSFINPPLIGLQNIGSTCYMNATLQCFSNTEVLTNYFLNEKNYDKIYNNNIAKHNPQLLQLSPSYLELINNLWKSNKKDYPPTAFRKRLADMNPLFKLGTPNDAKDLLTYLLIQLHDELNSYVPNKNNNLNNFDDNVNQYNEQEILNNFVQTFFGTNKSVLSDHFFGIQESKFLCTGCEKRNMLSGLNPPIKYNFQTFNFLIFPLEEVRIFKNKHNLINNMQFVNNMNQNQFQMFQFNNNNNNNNFIINNIFIQNNNNQNIVNIYDCFEYFQKDEIFEGDNAMWCNSCNGSVPCKNKTFIYTGPNVLIIVLNRGKGIQFQVKLEFYEHINLDNFILKKDKPSMIYDLYGVVTHLGESGESGHFVASCKSPCDNKWYRFNDAIVSPIKDVQSEIINFGMPYILFYKKC